MSAVNCLRILDNLDIPDPFDLSELVRRIGAARGRPLVLRPITTPPDGPCGIWVATAAADYVFYETATTRLHQEHIVLHELGHVLLAHDNGATLSGGAVRTMLPTLDPAAVRTALGRTHYADPDEAEAELFATLVLARCRRDGTTDRSSTMDHRARSPEAVMTLDRLNAIFRTTDG